MEGVGSPESDCEIRYGKNIVYKLLVMIIMELPFDTDENKPVLPSF